MKKYITLSLAIILTVMLINACSRGSEFKYRTVECNGDTLYKSPYQHLVEQGHIIDKYFPVWKKIMLDKTNLNQAFFNEHIKVVGIDTSVYNNTTFFSVAAEYSSDWATTDVWSRIIIKINNPQSPFYSLDLPVDQELTQEQILSIPDVVNNNLGNIFPRISKKIGIKYSFREAKEIIRKKLNISKACNVTCGLSAEGHLTLRYSDLFFDVRQYCSFAELDLISGNLTSRVTECIID